MFERFTDRARRVTQLAQEEARVLNHNYIGTEHVLLGLIREADGVAGQVLATLNVTLDGARDQVVAIAPKGEQAPTGHIPFTPRAKKVLELALREALQLGHNFIGTEHILLGLIREGEGHGAQALVAGGVALLATRQAVLKTLAGYADAEAKPRRATDGDQDIRVWRAGSHYGLHLYAVNPDGEDEPLGTALSPAIAAQIVAEHSLCTAAYADEEHQGGSWVHLLGQLLGENMRLQQRLENAP